MKTYRIINKKNAQAIIIDALSYSEALYRGALILGTDDVAAYRMRDIIPYRQSA
jgi:hypothetical protein